MVYPRSLLQFAGAVALTAGGLAAIGAAVDDPRSRPAERPPTEIDPSRGAESRRENGPFLAGAAVVDVTPQHLPIRVAGSIAETTADHVHSHLFVRAIVLGAGGPAQKMVIAVVDNCLVPRDLLDRAKQRASERTGIPVERMLVSATHTHSAPPVTGIHGNDPETAYAAFLQAGIARAIESAAGNLAPATAAWGTTRCDEHVFCRRWLMQDGTAFSIPFTDAIENRAQMNPGHDNPNKIRPLGPVDPEVAFLSLRHAGDGAPLALLANYSTHYVGAPGISSDYFGVFAERIAALLLGDDGAPVEADRGPGTAERGRERPPFVGILSNGTSGDANCIDFSRAPVAFDVESVADRIARGVADAARDLDHEVPTPGTVGILEERLTLNVRMPSRAEVAEAQAFLDQNVVDRPVRTWEENYARETVLLAKMPPTRELRLQVLRVGEFAATAIPCEVYGSTGLALKKASPFKVTMNIGLANGYDGYLPPPDQFPLGGYTTWRARSSCLEHQAEPKIVATIRDLLQRVEAVAE